MKKKRIHYIKIIKTMIVMLIIFLFISPFFIMISTSLKEFTEITKWPPTWIPDVLRWRTIVMYGVGTAILEDPFLIA